MILRVKIGWSCVLKSRLPVEKHCFIFCSSFWKNTGSERRSRGSIDTNERIDDGDEALTEKTGFWGSSVVFANFEPAGPRVSWLAWLPAKGRVERLFKLSPRSQRQIFIVLWSFQNCHFSLSAVLELGSSRKWFDAWLRLCIVLVIVCAGVAQTYFSPRLPTCVHFRKMEHFSSLERKVREGEMTTSTLIF